MKQNGRKVLFTAIELVHLIVIHAENETSCMKVLCTAIELMDLIVISWENEFMLSDSNIPLEWNKLQ